MIVDMRWQKPDRETACEEKVYIKGSGLAKFSLSRYHVEDGGQFYAWDDYWGIIDNLNPLPPETEVCYIPGPPPEGDEGAELPVVDTLALLKKSLGYLDDLLELSPRNDVDYSCHFCDSRDEHWPDCSWQEIVDFVDSMDRKALQ